MIESPMVKLLILDFDGTLADTRDKIVAVLQHVMAGQGLPVADAKTCASVIGYHLKQCFQIIYPHLTDAEADGCVDAYRRYFAAHEQSLVPELFPQVREALEVFHREGVRMAIASSRTSKSLCSFVAAMGLSDYFPLVVGGEDVERAKPAPDAVLAILSATGVFPEEALVVGDMPVDIQMGRAAGVRTVGVTYGNSSREQLLFAGADYLIDSFSELTRLI